MRRALLPAVAATLVIAGCSSAEFGLGMSDVAVPSRPCIPASEIAISAVADGLNEPDGALLNAYVVRVNAAEQGFGQYPSYIFAARLVSLSGESPVAVWSLGDDASFRPIYPLDETAKMLTQRGQSHPQSFLAEQLDLISASPSAVTARECVDGTTPSPG